MIKSLFKSLVHDEGGGEVIEYALIAGLIVAGCVGAIAVLGGRAKLGWTWIGSKM